MLWLVLSLHIWSNLIVAMMFAVQVFLMEYYVQTEIIWHTMFVWKGIQLLSWFHNKIFHQNTRFMPKWESVVCCSNALLNNATIFFSSWNMFLRCCIIHFDCRIFSPRKWIHHLVEFIIAVDLCAIKTTFLVDCQEFVRVTFVYKHTWFCDVLRGPVLYFMGYCGQKR